MEIHQFTGPLNGEKDVKTNKKEISRVFNQNILLNQGVVRLRKGSQTGEILEEFDSKSKKVLVSARELVLFPEKNLPYESEIFLTMDDGFVVSKDTGESCNFLNESSNTTFSFTTEDPIGKPLDGGIIISKDNGRYLVVSPKESELNLFFEEKEKSIEYTEKITGTTGWFIPSSILLNNKDLNVSKLWFKFDEDNNIFWTNDNYAFDMHSSIIFPLNNNILAKVRTFKFVGV
jgi:hypothetical protein